MLDIFPGINSVRLYCANGMEYFGEGGQAFRFAIFNRSFSRALSMVTLFEPADPSIPFVVATSGFG